MSEFPETSLDHIHLTGLILLSVLLTVSVYMELKERRIPNYLTFPAMACGLLLGYIPGGVTLMSSVAGFGLGFGILFVFYLFGGMGGGDVKLMGAVGALMGYPLIVPTVVNTAVIGGVMAIFVMIRHLDFRKFAGILVRHPADEPDVNKHEKQDNKKATIPYGLAIATGCMITLLLH